MLKIRHLVKFKILWQRYAFYIKVVIIQSLGLYNKVLLLQNIKLQEYEVCNFAMQRV